jgi:hypothetical protein
MRFSFPFALAPALLAACATRHELSFEYRPPEGAPVAPGRTLVLEPVRDARPEVAGGPIPAYQVGEFRSGRPIEVADREPLAAALERALGAELAALGFALAGGAGAPRLAVEIREWGAEPDRDPALRARLEVAVLAPDGSGGSGGSALERRGVEYAGHAPADPYWGAWLALARAHRALFADLVQALVRRNEPIRAALGIGH